MGRSRQRAKKCCPLCCTTILMSSRIPASLRTISRFPVYARRQLYLVLSLEPPLKSLFNSLHLSARVHAGVPRDVLRLYQGNGERNVAIVAVAGRILQVLAALFPDMIFLFISRK